MQEREMQWKKLEQEKEEIEKKKKKKKKNGAICHVFHWNIKNIPAKWVTMLPFGQNCYMYLKILIMIFKKMKTVYKVFSYYSHNINLSRDWILVTGLCTFFKTLTFNMLILPDFLN